jgi:hypothetical protein
MSAKRSKQTAKNLGRGVGRDGQWYVILAGLVTQSLNERFGLGLTPQEILSAGAALMVGATRLKNWLDQTGESNA